MKSIFVLSMLLLSAPALAGTLNCFWVEKNTFRNERGRIGSLNVAATAVFGSYHGRGLTDVQTTTLSINNKPETTAQTATSFGIYPAQKSMNLTFFQTGDTNAIIYTIQARIVDGDDKNALLEGTLRMQMPAGNSFTFPANCSISESN